MRIFGREPGKSALQEMLYLRPMSHSVHDLPNPLTGASALLSCHGEERSTSSSDLWRVLGNRECGTRPFTFRTSAAQSQGFEAVAPLVLVLATSRRLASQARRHQGDTSDARALRTAAGTTARRQARYPSC